MAINYELLNKGGISLGTNFELLSEKPLDSRLVVPSLSGLQNYIDNAAAYAGMIVYVSDVKKTYQVVSESGALTYKEIVLKTEEELKNLITSETTAAMEFKGVATELPANPAKGDFYKVTAEFEVNGETVKLGDSIVYDGTQWFIIPSGDDIEDTWRPIANVNNDATLSFADGDKIEAVVAATGEVKFNHEKLDEAAAATKVDNTTRTYVTEVDVDEFGHVTGYKVAEETVDDTNTTYTLEGQVESSEVYVTLNGSDETSETVYFDAYSKNEADGKFDAKGSAKDVKDYADQELAKKLDANGWSTNEDGVLAFSKQEDGGILQSTAINEDGVTVQASAGYLHYTASGISGTIDGAYLGTFDVTYDHIKIDDNEFLYPEQAGTLAVTKDIDDKITEATKDFGDIVNHDAAEFATAAQGALADSAVQTETFNQFKTDNTQAIADAVAPKLNSQTFTEYTTAHASDYTNKQIDDAIATATGSLGSMSTKDAGDYFTKDETAQKIESYAYATDTNAKKYATDAQSAAEAKAAELDAALKAELTGTINGVDAKFANYNTTSVQKAIDDAQDARIKAIEDDYLVEADIADFETKANVQKVADDLADYVESNDAALAAETKARTDADAGFESRIATLEGYFGEGEGTVEDQIAAAVKVEEDARKLAVQGVQGEVDALEGRMDTAEGKITTLEGASATKTELANGLALKADKSVVDAMYTNAKIDELLATKQDVIPAETYDAYGAAAAAETAAKGYADQKLLDFENAYIKADDNGTIDKLNEIAAWIADDEAGATKIISDVATNAANIKTVGEDLDKVELQLNGIAQGDGTVKAAINLAEQNAKDYADGELAKKLDANGWSTTGGDLAKEDITVHSNGSIEFGKDDYTTLSSSTTIDKGGIHQGHYDYGVVNYNFPDKFGSADDNGKTYTLATTSDITDAFNGWDHGDGLLSWQYKDYDNDIEASISAKDGIVLKYDCADDDEGGITEITHESIKGIKYADIAVKNDITTAISNLDLGNTYEAKGTAQTLIEGLDVTVAGMGAGKTLATLTETDGKIAATFQDIEITSSQVTDLAATVKAIQVDSAVKATQDGDGNVISTTYRKVETKITSDDLSDEVFVFDCGTATTII